ncbi:MAG: glycosyltransferase [Bacteroidia bacterium]|nr:glycosyltransferase [Bacteroidia bacterium]
MHWLPAILILPYLLLLLKIYRSLLKITTFNVSTDPVTFVSVVVACRNEQGNLPFLLKCIAGQDYPKGLFEIVIVDDNSIDKTYEIASGFSGNINIIAVNNKGKGKKQAIRTGIIASSGKLIITTDADCRMGKRWIKTIAAFFEKCRPNMIICPVRIEPGTGFFERFQELEFLSLQGITAGSAISGEGTMCNGANLAFTRETYLDHIDNLHSEIASGDDVFLLHSLKKQIQSKILWLESADSLVTAASSPTFGSFLKQRRRWISKGKAYNDGFTILLGIVTFVTIILEVSILVAGFINPAFILVFLTIFLLKSVPDFLILLNTTGRYGRKNLMNWFLPVQIIYPFYVLSVLFFSLISHKKPEY